MTPLDVRAAIQKVTRRQIIPERGNFGLRNRALAITRCILVIGVDGFIGINAQDLADHFLATQQRENLRWTILFEQLGAQFLLLLAYCVETAGVKRRNTF